MMARLLHHELDLTRWSGGCEGIADKHREVGVRDIRSHDKNTDERCHCDMGMFFTYSRFGMLRRHAAVGSAPPFSLLTSGHARE